MLSGWQGLCRFLIVLLACALPVLMLAMPAGATKARRGGAIAKVGALSSRATGPQALASRRAQVRGGLSA